MKGLLRLACYVLILSSRFIWGADFQVTNNADSGPGSFRQSIMDLNASGDSQRNTVTFDQGLGTIQLFSDLPAIEVEGEFITSTGDSLVIDGSGNQNRIFSTSNRFFNVNIPTTSSLTLSGTLDSGSLMRSGGGELILEGSNSYTGGTEITGGLLALSGSGSLAPTGEVVINSEGIFDISAMGFDSQTISNLSGSGGEIVLGAKILIIEEGLSTVYEGIISGEGSLIKRGSQTLILVGENTYTGGTTIIEGGLQGDTTSLQGDIENDALVILDQVGTGTYNGMITGTGAVTKQNTGTLILRGSNHTGGTTINGGGLVLLGRLPFVGSVEILAGTFDISSISASSQTIYNLSGTGGEIVLGTIALVAGSSDDTIYEGVISGEGSFTKQGSGTLTLSGIHTYTGTTTISSGRLALSGDGSLAVDNAVVLSGADSVFDIAEANDARSIGSLDGVEGSQIVLGANTLTIGDSNYTSYAGIISGTGAFIKQGSGKLILTGSNTYSGGTTVNEGVLQGNTNSLQGNILNSASVVFDQPYTGTYDGVLLGTGAIDKRNTGKVVFTGSNTYSGGTMITLGTLALSGSGTILPTGTVIINVGNFDISEITASSQTIGDLIGGGTIFLGEKILITATGNDTSYVGIINGAGSFVKQGSGTLTLSGANTYSGGTTIHAGTLALSGPGKLFSTGAVTIDAGAFDISNTTGLFQTIGDLSGSGGEILLGEKTLITATENDTSYAGVIRGSGALIKQGLGTLVLTGDNDYSGGTTVNDGALQGNTNSLQGNILNDAQLVFDQISSGTYEGIMTGNGNLIKQGPGMITFLSDCSRFLGTVSIHEGTLMMKGKIGRELEISANAMLAGIGTVENVINYGIVKPGSSIGTLTVNGNYTQGPSGILDIEIDEAGASSLLQVAGTATLDGVLQVNPEPGIYQEGTIYTFLTAGSVTGQFSSDFSTRPVNYVVDYSLPTQVRLLILSSSFITPAKPSGNAGVVADYLFCSSFDFTDIDFVAVTGALLELSASQYAQALNRLTPSQFGAFALNELENNFSIANTFFVNQRASCYATCESTNIWINPLGLVYSQKNRLQLNQEALGFTNHTYGVTAGIEHLLSNDWTLGFGLGYSYSHLHWKHQAGKARADSVYLGPYLGYHNGSFYFDFLVLGAGNFYDVDRKIVFPGISRTASSHPTTWDLSEVILAGFKFEPFYHFFVQPELLIDQLNIFQESFQESGANSIDLAVKRKHASFLRSLVNLKFVKEWVCCNLCLAPSVNVGWLRTTPLTGRHYTASFRRDTFCEPNFSATSFNQVIDQALVGTQFLLSSQGDFSVSLGYEGRFGNGSKVHEIDVALDWRF